MTATNNQLDLQLAQLFTPRHNRWPNARNLFDNTNDLVGVAELVVVPDVENKVVILGNSGQPVHYPGVGAAYEVCGHNLGGFDVPDLLSQAGEQ